MPPRIQIDGDNVSKPSKRMRWATQRKTGAGALRKRMSIVKRFHNRQPSAEEKRKSAGSDPTASEGSGSDDNDQGRAIYFNLPLPEEAKDEEGHMKNPYARNKIRTAKYTPLSFIPKNLWIQFHNIANIYFLFIAILSVSTYRLLIPHSTNYYHQDLRDIWRVQSRTQCSTFDRNSFYNRSQRRHRGLEKNGPRYGTK